MQVGKSENRALAMVASADYADGLLTTLASVLHFSEHKNFNTYIALEAGDDATELLARLHALCCRFDYPKQQLHLIQVEETAFVHLPPQRNGKRLSYFKCHLAQSLIEDSVLVLDADLLVLDDVDELFEEFESCGSPIAAVQDRFVGIHGDDPYMLDGDKGNSQDAYFNSGVFVICSNHCRDIDLLAEVNALQPRLKQLKYTDQTFLNLIFRKLWHQLPARWNQQTNPKTPVRPFAKPEQAAIVHFVTRAKPWSIRALDIPNLLWHHLSLEWGVISGESRSQSSLRDQIAHYRCGSRTWQQLKCIYYGLRKPGSLRHHRQQRWLALPEDIQKADRWLASRNLGSLPPLLETEKAGLTTR